MRPHPVRPWQNVAGRGGQPLRPPDGRSVEYKILLGTRIDGCRPSHGPDAAAQGDTFGHHLEAGNVRRISVEFPADQSWYPVALLHSSACEDPLSRPLHNPIVAPIEGKGTACAHQQGFIGSGYRERILIELSIFDLAGPAVTATAADDAILRARAARLKWRDAANGVSGEEQMRDARFHGGHGGVILAQVPILVVADAEKYL